MNRKTRQAQTGVSSVQWFGLVGAVACLGVIGYAVAHSRNRPEPRPRRVVMMAPAPQPVYVDVRSLAVAEPRRELEAPAAMPPRPADEIPGEIAKGTGVIAVKKGGKAKVAKVAAVADKPLDPNYRPFSPAPHQSAGPRVYGEAGPGYASSGGSVSGATISEASHGYRAAVGGIR
jgi:hypothetical protein